MKLFDIESYSTIDNILDALVANKIKYVRTLDTNNIYDITVFPGIGCSVELLKPKAAMEVLYDALCLEDGDDIPEQYLSADMINYLTEPEEKPTLTDADALADLMGMPRPDNPSAEATDMQSKYTEPGDPNYCKSCDIVSKIDGIILDRLKRADIINNESADVLLKLNQIAMSRLCQ